MLLWRPPANPFRQHLPTAEVADRYDGCGAAKGGDTVRRPKSFNRAHQQHSAPGFHELSRLSLVTFSQTLDPRQGFLARAREKKRMRTPSLADARR
jgi:hypothetical protein